MQNNLSLMAKEPFIFGSGGYLHLLQMALKIPKLNVTWALVALVLLI